MRKLNSAGLEQAVQKRNEWFIKCEAGTVIDDLMHPLYWAHVAKKLTMFDKIEAVAKDGTFYAELIVLRKADTSAKVKLINFIDLAHEDYSALSNALLDSYYVKFVGIDEWCVMQKTEKGAQVVLKGFPTEAEAERQRNLHIKAMAA